MSESGCRLDHPAAARFRQCVMGGEWAKADAALSELRTMLDDPNSLKVCSLTHTKLLCSRGSCSIVIVQLYNILFDIIGHTCLTLSFIYKKYSWCIFISHLLQILLCVWQEMRFLLLEQKYLELLESGQAMEALTCLRSQLTPLQHNMERVHQLSRWFFLTHYPHFIICAFFSYLYSNISSYLPFSTCLITHSAFIIPFLISHSKERLMMYFLSPTLG